MEQHDEVVRAVHALLGSDRLTGVGAIAPDAKYNRFIAFCNSNLLSANSTFMSDLNALRTSSKQNQGNNSHQRAAMTDEVRDRNTDIDRLVN